MPKAKLSQMATTWLDEEDKTKDGSWKGRVKKERIYKEIIDQPKKKQTFSLRVETIKRLWGHRARTSQTISETIDDLVIKHLPKGL